MTENPPKTDLITLQQICIKGCKRRFGLSYREMILTLIREKSIHLKCQFSAEETNLFVYIDSISKKIKGICMKHVGDPPLDCLQTKIKDSICWTRN